MMQAPNLEIPPSLPRATPLKRQLRGMTIGELTEYLESLGEPKFRAKQLYKWIHQKLARTFDEMTNVSKSLRARLQDEADLSSIQPHEAYPSPDGTTKMTFKLHDGAVVESVVIPASGRVTLCISSQVGCAINCQFCLTARMGLVRNLSTGEIVDQVAWAKELWEKKHDRRISNIVFMGMGEPLHNYANVTRALRILLNGQGLDFSKRKITLSTSGLVPAIRKLGQEDDIGVNLAISLNASDDVTRDEVMPINKRYNLDELLTALREYPLRPRQRITFEYVMLHGVNDRKEDAKRIVKMMRTLPAKVNLIPWNPFEGADFERPPTSHVRWFQEYLLHNDINTTVRETRGIEAMAACGQLGQPGRADDWRALIKEARKRARAERAAEASEA